MYVQFIPDERDYIPLRSRRITMYPGISRRSCFTVNIINDLIVEGNETFILSLSEPAEGLPPGVSINTTINGTVIRIVDSDSEYSYVNEYIE